MPGSGVGPTAVIGVSHGTGSWKGIDWFCVIAAQAVR